MRRLQSLGFHVKRGDAIEKLAAVNLAVFDMTGMFGVPIRCRRCERSRAGAASRSKWKNS
jgi:hypothetical protein